MKFAFISREGFGLPFWMRLRDEKHDVMVYVPDRGSSFVHRENGRGLITRAGSIGELLAWGGREAVYVFDTSEEGRIAEMLRSRGCLVIGGGEFCDRLEMDREFGTKIVRDVGVEVPDTKTFASITATITFLKGPGAGRDWYFKTDEYLHTSTTSHGDPEKLIRRLISYRSRFKDLVPNLLQETIDGPDISTCAWWNGMDWLGPYEGTVECKKFMAGDFGPATGCAFNVVWFYDELPKIAVELGFGALAPIFRAAKAPPGPYDLNGIISKKDRKVRFLEWTPRFGYDAEPTAMRAIDDLGKFYYDVASGRADVFPVDTTRAQMSVRLSVPPYPWEAAHELPSERRAKASGAVGVPIGGVDPKKPFALCGSKGNPFMGYGLGMEGDQLVVVDPTGPVGLMCADGLDVEDMNEAIMAKIDDLDIPDLQCRPDGGEWLDKHLAKVRALGFSTGVL